MHDVRDLAAKFGHVQKPAPDGDTFDAAHNCAAVMHGWFAHEYHHGPVEISEDDYLEALSAAAEGRRHEAANARPVK